MISHLFSGILICHLFCYCYDRRTLPCIKNRQMCVLSKLQRSLKCTSEGVLVQTGINSAFLHCPAWKADRMITSKPGFLMKEFAI